MLLEEACVLQSYCPLLLHHTCCFTQLSCLASLNCHMSECVIFKALDTPEPQPIYTTLKDQSILTTAPKALLVDDQFVDLCCSHLVLFPSAVPSLGERSHLASLPLKHKQKGWNVRLGTALWFQAGENTGLAEQRGGINTWIKWLLQAREGMENK